ncbi:MAG: diacylglycerol kinase family protein [Pseudomonadota bacterium]
MTLVALLSNPMSTGNRSGLPEVRAYCARHPDIFHYEVEEVDQIARALESIARVKPRVLVINGGDGTVQATLTEMYQGGHFGDNPPPVAVLPNGKTNLIALDLGADGNSLAALERIVDIAANDLDSHVIERQMIALSDGANSRPVLGMFLGGAGLAEIILYCRNKIYPLGLSNNLSHFLAACATIVAMLFNVSARFLPKTSSTMRISMIRHGEIQGSFALLMVTTLEKLLLRSTTKEDATLDPVGKMKFVAVENNRAGLWTMVRDTIFGRFGTRPGAGLHLERDDVIQIEGERGCVVLDGELFEAKHGKPITLRTTEPMPFLRIAA